ncbi:competence protein ComEC [Sinosporangium album]|uniref:Competence protein ComEC n=1 Tax=Sinosporangium album TaxID=504805 RepID=A0A1G7S757_9ACTN|nr:ComEC/Rec2 family competence protein [Sinosporangium album]SDG18010.1 competence protein ComEC [Sinosporangium album]
MVDGVSRRWARLTRKQAVSEEGPGGAAVHGHAIHLGVPALAVWVTALVLLGCSAATSVWMAAVSAAACLGLAFRVRRRGNAISRPSWSTVGLAAAVGVCAVSVVVAFRSHAIAEGPVAEAARMRAEVEIELVLTGDPRRLPTSGGPVERERFAVDGRIETLHYAGAWSHVRVPVVVLATGGAWNGLLPSQRVRLEGRLVPADRGELLAALVLARGSPQVVGGASPLQQAAGALRAGLREASDVLPSDQRGLLPGLVVGDTSRMDAQVEQDFDDAGLSHLTAVSGANLAYVAGAALALSRLVGLPLAPRAAFAVLAMVAFAVVARPSPSVLRALVMGVVAATALGTGRPRHGLTALAVAVLGLILFEPSLARSYGFALSVTATAGILVFAPPWRRRLATRMPQWPAEAIAVPAAAQLAVTPVLVLMAGGLNPVAVPANLLAGPAVPVATILGFAAALVAPLQMEVARWLVWPAGLATGWIITVAHHAAALPLGTLPWPGGLPGVLLLLAGVPLAVAVLRHTALRRAAVAATAGILIAVVAIRPLVAPWPPGRWLLVACDVGQGDALAVAAGPGRAVVVDTGPEPVAVSRCLRRLGVHDVPLVVFTHPHLDHVGGWTGVSRGRRVGGLLTSPSHDPAEDRGPSQDPALRTTRRWSALPGTRWTSGPSEFTVLGPLNDAPVVGPRDGTAVNNTSVVLHVRWRAGSAILSGDIETEAQADLLRAGLPQADVLKVPHHGSASQDFAFLAAFKARTALISAGADNDYGHPAPATLARLNWLGIRTFRTDLSGDLAIVEHNGGLAVVTRGRTPP